MSKILSDGAAPSLGVLQASAVHEHRPKSHQKHLEWTPSRLIQWAASVGPAIAGVCQRILDSKPHIERGLDSLPVEPTPPSRPPVEHDNIRGADYFGNLTLQ